jgi:hypothetical protein
MSRRGLLVSLAALAAGALALGGMPAAQAAPVNFLINGGFEEGVNPAPPTQGIDQPLVPIGWSVEGAAGLFDHTANDRRAGRRSAAISIPASGKRRACGPAPAGCNDLGPVNTVKDTAADKAVSVAPAWRPLTPVRVSPGVTYQVNGWVKWNVATEGEGGALVRVRWLDGNGVSLGSAVPVSWIANAANSFVLNWTFFAVNLVAPPGAVQAVPLFGAQDDAFITQVLYDEVFFGTP